MTRRLLGVALVASFVQPASSITFVTDSTGFDQIGTAYNRLIPGPVTTEGPIDGGQQPVEWRANSLPDHAIFGINDGARWARQATSSGSGGSWNGNFNPGEWLLHYNRPVDSNFASGYDFDGSFYLGLVTNAVPDATIAVARFGFYIQPDTYGPFLAQIRVQDIATSTWCDWYSATGQSTSQADNSALFLGAVSDTANILRVQVRARNLSSTTFGNFAVSAPRFSYTPVPEPTTIVATLIGFAAFSRRRRK